VRDLVTKIRLFINGWNDRAPVGYAPRSAGPVNGRTR
jgi:hypothetical protein